MGYSPQGRKESDTTERLHFTSCDFNVLSVTKIFRLEKNLYRDLRQFYLAKRILGTQKQIGCSVSDWH